MSFADMNTRGKLKSRLKEALTSLSEKFKVPLT
jgi:hypothetical protein